MNSLHQDTEENCIGEAIAQFYSFFGRMVALKNDIDSLVQLDEESRARILDQLESIEREYKGNQEWFVSREVQDIRVGVVGSEQSLKTALVSLFVEGALEVEGDERDGRSKSKITVEGKSKLLLIREETGVPSKQLCQWADVLLLVFSYGNEDSLLQVSDFYRVFREARENLNVPVVLVGIRDDGRVRVVRDGMVKKTIELLDKCTHFLDVILDQRSANEVFAASCQVAMATFSAYMVSGSCPIFPSSPSQSMISHGVHAKFAAPPPSPSQSKRANRRKGGFSFGGTKGAYSVSKQGLTTLAESYSAGQEIPTIGSGRNIPLKEGPINKKGSGGLRTEWKKKYLVLSESDLTYYPSLNDYMTMTHGKTVSLQYISVKVPGQRLPRATTAPPYHTDQTDLATQGNQSDHSNSASPPPPLDSSLDFPIVRVSGSPMPMNTSRMRHERSPTSPDDFELNSSSDTLDESLKHRFQYDHTLSNGRGHTRNSSMDEIMLQQLRTGGISYPNPEEVSDRAATMSRIHAKKGRERLNRGLLGVQGSEEFLSEGTTGSNESLGKPEKKRKGDKDRNSWISQGDPAGGREREREREKKGKSHKRQRSWGGNKLYDTTDWQEPYPETSEFQILSSDGKVWTFEASSPEEGSAWVKSIEDQIKKSLSESVSHKRVNSCNDMEKKEIFNMEGNDFCADCNSPNPEWASLNYGCVLCIECSGVHRKLGSHISRVRSLSLDEWSPELIALMLAVGNKLSRSVWEAKRPRTRPTYSTPREERERFIKAKYIEKEFLAELPLSNNSISEQLLEVVQADSVPDCLNILAHALPEDINEVDPTPPLHLACSLGRTVITQLLIWNGADINLLDTEKHSPLFIARHSGNQDIVSILLANSCDDNNQSPASSEGSTEIIHRANTN